MDPNEYKISVWTDGIEEVDGDKIKFFYVPGNTSVASTNVVDLVLEDMGYNVEMLQVEAGTMWTSVADGNAGAFLAG
ncbi:hypothetical protein CSV75_02925 [Sporosarcina sp. P18a]|uniref:glycine betaine ABC transporter substrate-binding protein n=1 Tax=Sporosarcina sp. P18a TaxID=2048259 RepID=UPI000C1723B9|nr:glycine betaine ABC transporter substrate-binding protein [Sporosarcina sp. P18a]PIC80757.1 hypothetical protein CSV75_02925 [Sporosarcina sp. P18a]